MKTRLHLATVALSVAALAHAQKAPKIPYSDTKPVPVPQAAPAGAAERAFTDHRYHVAFRIPPGWELARKDFQVSTFHLDARSATPNAKLRGLAMMDFNPFPYSTLAGALFYFSVEPRVDDADCAAQATLAGGNSAASLHDAAPAGAPDIDAAPASHKDVQEIAGMTFTHGHDQHGDICIEARDEVYTAWRKHACYRFDLTINTFCAEASGARPITPEQLHDIDARLTGILSTVVFGWDHTAPHPVPVPDLPTETPPAKPSLVKPVSAIR